MARECGFVQRKSKLTGWRFIDLVILNHQQLTSQSLNDLCITFNQRHGLDLTKQGLSERFNEKAILFLKAIIEELMGKKLEQESGKMIDCKSFTQILIKDSTCFQISESLATEFPGSGGAGSKAAVRIQFEYDLLTGKVKDISLHAFNNQDISNAKETLCEVEKGSLLVRDLGYIQKCVIEEINAKGAYFINRLHPVQTIYEEKKGKRVEVNFNQIWRSMKKKGVNRVSKLIYLSKTSKISFRLIVEMVPEECVKNRIRKANKNARKKGTQVTDKYKSRARLGLYITNTTVKQVGKEDVSRIYRLRWQIELIFKAWKSICNLHQVKAVQRNRLLAYIYGRLILILISWHFYWLIAKRAYLEKGQFLSFFKTARTLYENVMELRKLLITGSRSIKEYLNYFYEQSLKYHLLEKRKGKTQSMTELVSLFADKQAITSLA